MNAAAAAGLAARNGEVRELRTAVASLRQQLHQAQAELDGSQENFTAMKASKEEATRDLAEQVGNLSWTLWCPCFALFHRVRLGDNTRCRGSDSNSDYCH